jgi:hypothetical protein
MTDNVPAIPDPTPRRDVATTDTDSWVQVAAPIMHLAERIADTEFVPRGLRGSIPATAAAILYGREVGLPPMTALNVTHVIEGKPGISAEAMRAMVYAAGHELEFLETTGAVCSMRGRRNGQERWTSLTWTLDMARAAGLLGKSNWKSYPRALLVARCTTDLCRMVFPDVIHGFRTVEELEDLDVEAETDQPQSGATVKRAASKRTAKKAAAAPFESPAERPAVAPGPPLPGEDGYEKPTAAGAEPVAPELPVGGEGTSEGEAGAPNPPTGTDSPGLSGVEAKEEEEGASTPPDSSSERRGPRKATRAQHRMIHAQLAELEVTEEDRHWITGAIVGRPVESFNDLTTGDASKVVDTLARCTSRADLDVVLEAAGDQS